MAIPHVVWYVGGALVTAAGGYGLWKKRHKAKPEAAAAAPTETPVEAPTAPATPAAPTAGPSSAAVTATAAQPQWFKQHKRHVVGGLPVMTGDVAADLAALMAWHGSNPGDAPLVRHFQRGFNLPQTGYYDPMTVAAFRNALHQRGLQMPTIMPYQPRMPYRSWWR